MRQVDLRELNGCAAPRIANDAPVMSVIDYFRAEALVPPSPRGVFALYVSSLVVPLCTELRSAGRSAATTKPLSETNLTNLFHHTYGVDVTSLALRERDPFRLACKILTPSRSCVQLKYQAMGNPQGPFWRLTLDGAHDTVQMRCISPKDPLTGFADITQLPGVEDALRSDIEMLIDVVTGTLSK